MTTLGLHDLPDGQRLTFRLPATAAGSLSKTWAVAVLPFRAKVVGAGIATLTKMTGDATDRLNFNLVKEVSGASDVEIANLDCVSGTDVAAEQATALTINSSNTESSFAKGTVISLQAEKINNGFDMEAIVGYVEVEAA